MGVLVVLCVCVLYWLPGAACLFVHYVCLPGCVLQALVWLCARRTVFMVHSVRL